jgi:cytochrome c oxidase cbb3-type subunit 3
VADVNASIHAGRQGWMPAWDDRLSLADRKILTAYLLDHAEGAPQ